MSESDISKKPIKDNKDDFPFPLTILKISAILSILPILYLLTNIIIYGVAGPWYNKIIVKGWLLWMCYRFLFPWYAPQFQPENERYPTIFNKEFWRGAYLFKSFISNTFSYSIAKFLTFVFIKKDSLCPKT